MKIYQDKDSNDLDDDDDKFGVNNDDEMTPEKPVKDEELRQTSIGSGHSNHSSEKTTSNSTLHSMKSFYKMTIEQPLSSSLISSNREKDNTLNITLILKSNSSVFNVRRKWRLHVDSLTIKETIINEIKRGCSSVGNNILIA
jgi:hypothetical protein